MTRVARERTSEPENEAQRRALAFLQLEGSSLGAAAFPGPGDRVADFVIEHELGRGGAGVVYRARQLNLGRSVALKLIPHGPAALTEAYARRLEREGRMLASVRHESIPTVHAAGVVPGFHYVAVDLVEGTTLRELIRGGASSLPCPGDPRWLPFLLGVLHRIAGALGAAHARGIVHRDVKPGNVLVDREERPFLVDFGLAREQDVTGTTLTYGFVGTPQYASPEQVRGEPLGPASDVFSFGVLAFEAVCGRRPFGSESTHALAHEILFADPAWPATPRDLRAVIERCLEKRVARRYVDAREVEAEFARLLSFEPVLAVPRGLLAQAWGRVRRRPVLATACLGALVASIGISATFLYGKWASMREEALGLRVQEVFRLFGPGRFDEYREGLDELLREPNCPIRVFGRRADLHLLEGQPAQAVALYRRSLEGGSKDVADRVGYLAASAASAEDPWRVVYMLDPTTNRDFMVIALAHELYGDIPAAEVSITQAIDKGPLPVLLHLIRAKFLTTLGRTSLLATELELACQLRSDDVRLAISYAQTLHLLHRFEDEEQFLVGRLAAVPEEAGLLAELATCRSRLGKHEAAIEAASRAHELAPRNGRVVEALALGLVSADRLAEASGLLDEAARTMPGDPYVLRGSAQVALRTGLLEEAEWLVRELDAIDDWNGPALELRGEIQLARGNHAEALSAFEELEEREPEILDRALAVARTLEGAGDLVGAERAVDRALALAPSEPEVLWAKARLLRATERPREALRVLQRALWRRAEEGITNYWLALTWLELDQPGEALRCAREAASLHRDWPEALDLLERCEAAAGMQEDVDAPVPREDD